MRRRKETKKNKLLELKNIVRWEKKKEVMKQKSNSRSSAI